MNTKTLYSILFPALALGVMQIGGCARSETPPPPPGGVYVSEDGGHIFEQSVNIAGEEGAYIASFHLGNVYRMPIDTETIYIAAGPHGYVYSENNGRTWHVGATPLSHVRDVVVLEDDILVVSGTDAKNQGFVLRSMDGGETWENVLTIPLPVDTGGLRIVGGPARIPISMHVRQDPFNPSRLYGGSNLGTIYAGEQGAKTWRTLQRIQSTRDIVQDVREEHGVERIISSPYTSGDIAVITKEQKLIWIGRDGRQSEIVVPQDVSGVQRFSTRSQNIHHATFIPEFPDALMVGTDQGVFITRDKGETWVQLPIPAESARAFQRVVAYTSPVDPDYMIASMDGVIYLSQDGGSTWVVSHLDIPKGFIVHDLSIDPAQPFRILAIVRETE